MPTLWNLELVLLALIGLLRVYTSDVLFGSYLEMWIEILPWFWGSPSSLAPFFQRFPTSVSRCSGPEILSYGSLHQKDDSFHNPTAQTGICHQAKALMRHSVSSLDLASNTIGLLSFGLQCLQVVAFYILPQGYSHYFWKDWSDRN